MSLSTPSATRRSSMSCAVSAVLWNARRTPRGRACRDRPRGVLALDRAGVARAALVERARNRGWPAAAEQLREARGEGDRRLARPAGQQR